MTDVTVKGNIQKILKILGDKQMKIFFSVFYSEMVNLSDNAFWQIKYISPDDGEPYEGIVLFVEDKHIVLADGEHYCFDYEMKPEMWFKIERLLSDVVAKVYELCSKDNNVTINIPEIEKELFEQRKGEWLKQGLLTERKIK